MTKERERNMSDQSILKLVEYGVETGYVARDGKNVCDQLTS